MASTYYVQENVLGIGANKKDLIFSFKEQEINMKPKLNQNTKSCKMYDKEIIALVTKECPSQPVEGDSEMTFVLGPE